MDLTLLGGLEVLAVRHCSTNTPQPRQDVTHPTRANTTFGTTPNKNKKKHQNKESNKEAKAGPASLPEEGIRQIQARTAGDVVPRMVGLEIILLHRRSDYLSVPMFDVDDHEDQKECFIDFEGVRRLSIDTEPHTHGRADFFQRMAQSACLVHNRMVACVMGIHVVCVLVDPYGA
jgi:hypothetical protein